MSSHSPLARGAAAATVALLLIGYQLLAHRISASSNPAFWEAILAVTPLSLLSLWLAGRARRPGPLLALWLAVMAAVAYSWTGIQAHLDWVYFAQHLGANLLLMLSMGLSLLPGREPLCSRLATRVHGPLTTEVTAYTRGVTAAWTLFFGLMATASGLLFWLAPVDAWSVFANLLTGPLVLLMFAGEYGVRVWVIPPSQRSGPLEAIRAYWGSRGGSREQPMSHSGSGDPEEESRASSPEPWPPAQDKPETSLGPRPPSLDPA